MLLDLYTMQYLGGEVVGTRFVTLASAYFELFPFFAKNSFSF